MPLMRLQIKNQICELCLEKQKNFRGLGQYGVTNITSQSSTHITVQLFQAVLVQTPLIIQSISYNSNVWVIERKLHIVIHRDLYSLLIETSSPPILQRKMKNTFF